MGHTFGTKLNFLGQSWGIVGAKSYLGHTWGTAGAHLGHTWGTLGANLGHKVTWGSLGANTFLHVSCYPVYCEPKIFCRFFEVCTYSSIAIHNFGFEASPCNAISEGRPPLSDRSSEAGALPLQVRIENDWDRQFSKSNIFRIFLETSFLHVSCYPIHCEPKIFFRLSKSATTPRYTILDSRPPLVMQSQVCLVYLNCASSHFASTVPQVCPKCAPAVPQLYLPQVAKCAPSVPQVTFCPNCASTMPQVCPKCAQSVPS